LALTLGTRLGVYEITALIGEGDMGPVYRATDTQLKRQVAIKVMPSSLAADRDRLARFQREAEVRERVPRRRPPRTAARPSVSLPPYE
jgi:serine/threonine protein kinase